jgi:light-regulated signal transduction histidine kinase (bacteriophytochrome)
MAERHRADQPERLVEVIIEPGARAVVDSSLVEIMLANLFSNAWKFTRQNASARIVFGHQQVGGEDVFHMRDNGVGFDMARADKLFRPFGRLHPQEEFEGTGVGLTIVLRIVERHGGRVWAEATSGHGAVFYFTLAPVPGVRPVREGGVLRPAA